MAEVKVNAEQWNALSNDDQNRIVEALRETGALRDEDQVVADPDTAPFTEESTFEPMWNPIKDVCKMLCDSATAAAAAWCVANTGGVLLAACLAVAKVAQKECRKRC